MGGQRTLPWPETEEERKARGGKRRRRREEKEEKEEKEKEEEEEEEVDGRSFGLERLTQRRRAQLSAPHNET